MVVGALKSELMHEGPFDKFGTQIEKITVNVVGKPLINTRGSGIGFTLHIRKFETIKTLFLPFLKETDSSSSSSLCAGAFVGKRPCHRRSGEGSSSLSGTGDRIAGSGIASSSAS